MPQILQYHRPVSTRTNRDVLRFWGFFLLSGLVGVPGGEAAISYVYHEQELFSFGGLVLSAIFLLISAGGLAVLCTAMPKWFFTARAAIATAIVGPFIGLVTFCLVVH